MATRRQIVEGAASILAKRGKRKLAHAVMQIRGISKKGRATVEVFLAVLTSKLTQYDMSESRKEMKRRIPTNIYRLGLLFEASEKVRNDMTKQKLLNEDTPEALEKLKKSLNTHFTRGFRPVKTVITRIDKYIQTGKIPSLK